jgi:hypothetical protein
MNRDFLILYAGGNTALLYRFLLHYPASPVPQVENELEGKKCKPDLGSG